MGMLWNMMLGACKIDAFFKPMEFIYNLKYMGLGMLGIFVVIGLIILATVILNRATSGKKNKSE